MPAGAILYVGDDISRRIPVLESTGAMVLRAQCSVAGVRKSCATGRLFSIITFHNDRFPPPLRVISTVRKLSPAPLILFRNPNVECDERLFDIIMPVAPYVCPKPLEMSIKELRKTWELSQSLRQEFAALRERSRMLREASRRNCIRPVIDYDSHLPGGW